MKRKVILFVVAQLLLFGVLFLTMNVAPNFDLARQNLNEEAVDVTIEIVKGFPEFKDSLELNPLGVVPVYGGMKVTWVIREGSNVDKYKISTKKSSRSVFKYLDGAPTWFYRRNGKARLADFERDVEYKYGIHWKDKNGGKHYFDPKIAVKPGARLFIFELIVYILYAIVAFVTSLKIFKS